MFSLDEVAGFPLDLSGKLIQLQWGQKVFGTFKINIVYALTMQSVH